MNRYVYLHMYACKCIYINVHIILFIHIYIYIYMCWTCLFFFIFKTFWIFLIFNFELYFNISSFFQAYKHAVYSIPKVKYNPNTALQLMRSSDKNNLYYNAIEKKLYDVYNNSNVTQKHSEEQKYIQVSKWCCVDMFCLILNSIHDFW
jgi:hypothetical protein